jgi:hypothetical protein
MLIIRFADYKNARNSFVLQNTVFNVKTPHVFGKHHFLVNIHLFLGQQALFFRTTLTPWTQHPQNWDTFCQFSTSYSANETRRMNTKKKG